jgi:hypothetical protein
MISIPDDTAVFSRREAQSESDLDDLAYALVCRHIAADLRGDVSKVVTTARLRRINRLWEDGMAGALRHEMEMAPAV